MDAVERAAKERRLAMTKQISRDDADALAAQLAEANEELEKLEANVTGAMNELHRRAGERQRLLFLRNKSLEAQLAAANERAEKQRQFIQKIAEYKQQNFEFAVDWTLEAKKFIAGLTNDTHTP